MPQLPTSCVVKSGHSIFVSQHFGISLVLSVILPFFLQTINTDQTIVLPPPMNQVSTQ